LRNRSIFATMVLVSRLLVLVLVLVAAGCYAPSPLPGTPCSPSLACPYGLVCSPATLTCEARAIDAGVVGDGAADSSIDALVDARIDAAIDAPNLPVLVQEAAAFTTSADSLSLTLPSVPVAGNVLVMIGGDPQSSLASVTGGGVSWTLAARSTVEANIELWVGVTDGSSATVTISLPGTIAQMSIAVSEWANLAPANLIDVTKASSGGSSPASTGSLSTTSAPTLVLLAAAAFGATTWGVPTGGAWTPMMGVSGAVSQAAWYRVVTAPGTFGPIVTENGGSWDAALVALRGAP